MRPLAFLLQTLLRTIQKTLSLLRAGNVDEAISGLEQLESVIEKNMSNDEE